MVNNVSFSVTNRCNSHCTMCNIWKEKSFYGEMSVAEIEKLFSHQCFAQVDTISLTGGEPFLRNDLIDIIQVLKGCMPKLQRLFLNTNATCPDVINRICVYAAKMFEQVILSVSIEGTKETHNKLRGIDNYDCVIDVLGRMAHIPNLNLSLSMTLSRENANMQNLQHVYDIAHKNNAMFNFRLADKSSTYYKNMNMDLSVPVKQKQEVSRFIATHCGDNEFLMCLKQFIDTGHLDLLMQNGENKCLAGKTFVFVHPNGVISPCLYSTQQITPEQLLTGQSIVVGEQEPCPCCTDCAIYPMLEARKRTR